MARRRAPHCFALAAPPRLCSAPSAWSGADAPPGLPPHQQRPCCARLTAPDRARAGLHSGRRQPIAVRPQAMLEAKDLPRCDLSDFIERRLALAVGRDRHERARLARLPVEQARAPPLVFSQG
jgi:hypothetical protein